MISTGLALEIGVIGGLAALIILLLRHQGYNLSRQRIRAALDLPEHALERAATDADATDTSE